MKVNRDRIWGRAEMRADDVGASYFGASAGPVYSLTSAANFTFFLFSLLFIHSREMSCGLVYEWFSLLWMASALQQSRHDILTSRLLSDK